MINGTRSRVCVCVRGGGLENGSTTASVEGRA